MSALKPPRPWPLDKLGKPKRRVAVPENPGIYWRADGLFEVGYRDADGRLRWRGPFETISSARAARGDARTKARGGERESANPRLKFGEAADRWLAEQVVDLRRQTRSRYKSHVTNHLRPRWGNRRLDAIDVTDAARLVRDLRASGLAESSINGILQVANRVFKFARRRCRWRGENPIELLETSERARPSQAPEPRIYEGDELAQTLAASWEPWTTIFRLADDVGGRESELLGLWWENLDLSDPSTATIRFTHQLERGGERVELKTEESKATLPLPRASVRMLLEHKARTRAPTGPQSFVFATRDGKPLSQRNLLRVLYVAQERARDANGRPTFPELFEHDARGELVVDERGEFVRRDVKRRELRLPTFHALRHGAAMDCDDAEEARDLLRHKNSNVTRAVYRAHFGDRRRELLRARMEARMETRTETSMVEQTQRSGAEASGEVADLRDIRRGQP
jgi:integrase